MMHDQNTKRRRHAVWRHAVWCFALGCSTDDAQKPCWETPAEDAPKGDVQLGANDEAGGFVPFGPGADVTLVHGLQGGHHFAVRTQIRGMTPGA